MRYRTLWVGIVLALCATLSVGGVATAGTVGKVTGRVIDAKGDPLPGASVVLVGARKGAVTDKDGVYVILTVDPGAYTATASLIGFHSVTKSDVRVQVDLTTTVDFRLQEQAVEMAEMVVQAERPPVEPDKTESRYVVTIEDIQRTPILREGKEFLELEAGMAKDGSGEIRSGLPEHNVVFVDGIRLQNTDGRGPTFTSQWWGVNVKAVQEISLITGGMNAEYGNAQAGVVNMVTRDGSQKYHGEFEYRFTPAGKKHWGANVYDAPEHQGRMRWDDPAWVSEVDPVTGRLAHQRLNYTDWRGHYFDGSLSGPLTKSAYFFVSAVHRKDAAVIPGAWSTRPFNIRTTAKLTVPVGQNVKLRVGWIYERWKDFQSGQLFSTNVPNVLRGPGRDIFLPEGSPAATNTYTEKAYYAVMTHTISPKTFYELRVSRYGSRQDTSDTRGLTTADVRTDKAGWFYLGRNQVWNYVIGEQNRTGVKFDLSSQVTKGHFFKTGFDFTAYSNWTTWEGGNPGNRRKDIEFIGDRATPGKPVRPKQLALYIQDKMEFQGLIVNAGLRYDRFWGIDMPLFGALRAYLYDSLSRFKDHAPFFPIKPIVNWSPRLGISHPITSRSALHFFYGHFYQIPSFRRLYKEQWFATAAGIPGVPYSEYRAAGRPTGAAAVWPIYDDAQRTISFELGLDWNFVHNYTAALNAFFKSGSFGEWGGWNMAYNPVNSARAYVDGEANVRWEDDRGFEFSLRKDFSHYFTFRAAFNVEWQKQGTGGGGDLAGAIAIVPDSNWIVSSPYLVKWQESNGVQQAIPLTEAERKTLGQRANALMQTFRTDPKSFVFCEVTEVKPVWERPGLTSEAREAARGLWYVMDDCPNTFRPRGRSSQGSLQTYFALPQDFGGGPKFAGGTFLGNLSGNLIYRLYTGLNFTYLSLDGSSQARGRRPLHTSVDLNVQKRFTLGGMNADLFIEVFNLFNQKDTNATGTDYMWWGLQTPRPDDANYLRYGDFQDRTRYLGSPRQWHTGIRMSF
jgi:hypothetical protein